MKPFNPKAAVQQALEQFTHTPHLLTVEHLYYLAQVKQMALEDILQACVERLGAQLNDKPLAQRTMAEQCFFAEQENVAYKTMIFDAFMGVEEEIKEKPLRQYTLFDAFVTGRIHHKNALAVLKEWLSQVDVIND